MKSKKQLSIGITGKMGAGKTTVSKLLSQEIGKANVLQIAGKLKKIIRDLELPYKREILQETGDFFRQWDQLIWVKSVLRDALNFKDNSIIIDDIRYKSESEKLKNEGFWIIRVNTDPITRRARLAKRDNIDITNDTWDKWTGHPTEQEVNDIKVDFEIDNNIDYDDLIVQISKFVKTLKK